MIQLEGISKTYSGEKAVHALTDVNLHIPAGKIFGIIGPSGAGKSTLLRCINLLEKPDAGAVWVDGVRLDTLGPKELRQARQKMGMVFQHFNLLSSRTVAENVAFPLEVAKVSSQRRKQIVADLLQLVGLEDKANAYPAQLSGGQKQRVGIATHLPTNREYCSATKLPQRSIQKPRKFCAAAVEVHQSAAQLNHRGRYPRNVCDSGNLRLSGRPR